MLLEGNLLPNTMYEAKQIVYPVGLKIEKIHACWNNCVLFRGENEDLDNCPECGMSRYKRRKDGGDDGEDNMDERKQRGLLGKLHGTFLWFPDCSGCLQTRRRRSCCVGTRRDVIKTDCYVTLQIVLNGDILITPMAGSVMLLGILGLP